MNGDTKYFQVPPKEFKSKTFYIGGHPEFSEDSLSGCISNFFIKSESDKYGNGNIETFSFDSEKPWPDSLRGMNMDCLDRCQDSSLSTTKNRTDEIPRYDQENILCKGSDWRHPSFSGLGYYLFPSPCLNYFHSKCNAQ